MEELKEKIAYPKYFDEYFKEHVVTVKQMPDKYRVLKQDALPDKTFKNSRTFVSYIKSELSFWSYEEALKNHIVSRYKNDFEQALANFNQALNYAENNQPLAINYLEQAINYVLNNAHISSKTELAKQLKKLRDKTDYFFYGFEAAISPESSNYNTSYTSWQEGFYYGQQYKQTISSIEKTIEEYKTSYIEAAKNAAKELNSIIEDSTMLFHSQEEKINSLWETNAQKLKQQEEETNSFIFEKQEQMQTLEDTYTKKLQLSKPAEYWKKLAKNYKWKGVFWFALSFLITGGIVTGIIFLLKLTPQLFQENKYWLDLIKDTALLTVITSVVIYILRITIKLAISSFHLSRDAKEREMLTGFYLSINSENAVSESERAIIINSLFSRADTGLLKGDSSPTMSANISELYNKDKSR